MSDTPKPWERQPKEGPKAWAAFVVYRNMGAGVRTVAKVAAQLGKGLPNYEKMARLYHWMERCKAYDAEQDRIGQETQKDVLIEMRRRHAGYGKLTQALAITEIRNALKIAQKKPGKIKPRDMAILLQLGVKIEQLALGEATDRVDTNVSGAIAAADITEAMKDREYRKTLDAAAARRERLASEPGGDGGEIEPGKVDPS